MGIIFALVICTPCNAMYSAPTEDDIKLVQKLHEISGINNKQKNASMNDKDNLTEFGKYLACLLVEQNSDLPTMEDAEMAQWYLDQFKKVSQKDATEDAQREAVTMALHVIKSRAKEYTDAVDRALQEIKATDQTNSVQIEDEQESTTPNTHSLVNVETQTE